MPSTTIRSPQLESPAAGPTVVWLCAGFLLAGMGTVMLGPLLPALSQRWHLQDVDAGLLLFAKFTGAFIGGISVPRRLRHGILFGLLASCTGLICFAFSTGPYTGAAALFLCGIGLGLVIASTNILAGRRYSDHTGSALALINFFWSLGAVAIGILIAEFLPHHSLSSLLLTFAVAYMIVALGGVLQPANTLSSRPERSAVERPAVGVPQITAPSQNGSTGLHPGDAAAWDLGSSAPEAQKALPRQTLIAFALMLFLYGGLETCLTQWLTTFSVRYTTGALFGGQSAIVVMWSALTVGRALTSVVLRRISETTLQRSALAVSVLLIPILANCTTARSLSIVCILLGLSLAPFFPATFALLMRRGPTARTAGFILAVSGLGAAALTYLMGLLSTHLGSLRLAMAIPFAAALCLLAISFLPKPAAPIPA